MKKVFLALAALIAFASSAFSAEPVLLQTSRNGNRFYLNSYEQSEGRITVVVRCLYSESELDKGVALLIRQGMTADKAQQLAGDEFSLRYSEDGSRYQRLFDRYIAADGTVIFRMNQNPDAWYDTPAQPQILPAQALLEAGRLLGIPVTLPAAQKSDGSDAASLQSSSPRRVMSVASLTAAYRADRKLFRADYENTILQVRGVRGNVSRDLDSLSLILLPSGGGEGILCLFSDDDAAQVTGTKRAAEIVVEGVYRPGKTVKGAFILDNCAIISK